MTTIQAADAIEDLEALIRDYLEAEADAAGGSPDKYIARIEAFHALRASVNWPTKASCTPRL